MKKTKTSMLCFLSPSAAAPGSPVVRKEVQGNPGQATAAAVTRRSTQRPFRSHWGCSILVGALIGRKRSSMTARASSTEGASELESRVKVEGGRNPKGQVLKLICAHMDQYMRVSLCTFQVVHIEHYKHCFKHNFVFGFFQIRIIRVLRHYSEE